MRRIRATFLASVFVLSLAAPVAAGPFTITQESDFNDLLNVLLGSTLGLSNFGGSLTGDAVASGVFVDDPFGLSNGVVLSTGIVTGLVGSNNSSSYGTDLGLGGPAGDTATLDLTFDSDGTASTLYFQYVFGSEEFYEYIGSAFNDFFTLKLDGTNFALLNCGQAVTINNFGLPACSPELVNNAGGTVTQLDAFTSTLIFAAPLTAGSHTLQFSIGDVGDGVYDSAVFIKGGSVGTEAPVVPEPSSLLLLAMAGLAAGARHRRQRS